MLWISKHPYPCFSFTSVDWQTSHQNSLFLPSSLSLGEFTYPVSSVSSSAKLNQTGPWQKDPSLRFSGTSWHAFSYSRLPHQHRCISQLMLYWERTSSQLIIAVSYAVRDSLSATPPLFHPFRCVLSLPWATFTLYDFWSNPFQLSICLFKLPTPPFSHLLSVPSFSVPTT